jgi:hypothetical protein
VEERVLVLVVVIVLVVLVVVELKVSFVKFIRVMLGSRVVVEVLVTVLVVHEKSVVVD